CHALEPGITTPTGACLRQNLSIYLGPDWSEQVQGTPYAALALGLPEDDAACRLRLDQLLACTAVPKLLWLLDARTERRLLRWLGEDAAPDQATAVFLVDDQLSREDSNYRSRYHRAQIVARRVDSLTDQLALLRGGLVLISEAGQLLAEVAALSGLPLALLDGQGQWVEGGQLQQAGSAEPAGRVADVSRVHAAEGLDAWLAGHVSSGYAARAAQAAIQAAAQSAQTRLGGAASPWQVAPGAAATLAERLRPWLQAVGVQVVTTPA
ncbi:MAG: hypothetical protein RL722_3008, partial [Pseudomonadota bacterium]